MIAMQGRNLLMGAIEVAGETSSMVPEQLAPEALGRFDYTNYQASRKGPGYVLMLLRQERQERDGRNKAFYGKFRCSVLLPSD